jgi:hypothetical protein
MISEGQEIVQTDRDDLPHHSAAPSHLISCDAQGHIEHRLEPVMKSVSANPLFVSFVAGPTGLWKIDRVTPVVGESLPEADRLQVIESPTLHRRFLEDGDSAV